MTALAVAYDRRYRDPRVHAAVILSGAALLGLPPPGDPAAPRRPGHERPDQCAGQHAELLPALRRPKFLVCCSARRTCRRIRPRTAGPLVERATVAFLDHYLRGAPLSPLLARGGEHDGARIVSDG